MNIQHGLRFYIPLFLVILNLNGCVTNSVANKPKEWPKEVHRSDNNCSHISGTYNDLYSEGENIEPYFKSYDGKRFKQFLSEGSLYFWLAAYSKKGNSSEGKIVSTHIEVKDNEIVIKAININNNIFTSYISMDENTHCKLGRLVLDRNYRGQGESHTSHIKTNLIVSKLENGDIVLNNVQKTHTNSAFIINYWDNSEKWVLFSKREPHNKSLKNGTREERRAP